MKKKNFLYTGTLALGMFMSGCSDSFLDMNNYGAYDDFNSETKITWYLAGLYQTSFENYTSPTSQYLGLYTSYAQDFNEFTDEMWGITSTSRIDPSTQYSTIDDIKTQTDASSGKSYDPLFAGYFGKALGSSVTNNAYTRIRNCNILLRDIDASSVSQDTKDKAKGQALFLRAMQLFDLVRVYGAVPVVNKVLMAADREGAKDYNRESVETCVNQILSDLKEAANLLPTRKEWGSDQYGRLTKEAALAYRSRVALVFASPIFNTDWNNTGNKRWKDALDITLEAQAFLSSEGYGLYGNSAKDWNEMFYKFDNQECKEVIMVKLLASSTSKNDEHSGWQKTIRLKTMGGSGSGYHVPMGMLDIFPMADGSKAVNDDGEAINGYDRSLFFKNRDPRFYYTFTFSGAKWGYDQDADAVVWNYRWSETKEDGSQLHYYTENEGSSPAIVRKMSDPAENSANTYQWDGTDVYEYRYAELLLNLAECYAATGDISNSVKTIGEIRARVGIPASNNYGLGTITDKNEAIKACLRERQVELAYEGKRYWDLWRWMLYNDDASDNNTTCTTLGIEPLNGTARVGKYLQVKDYDGKADPLASVIADFEPVDVDNAADLQAEMNRLGEFWSQHFVLEDRETPVDNVNGQEAVISWQENYYLSGLPSNVLNMNPWLEQSKGWLDYYESEGTLDARK